MTPFAVVWLWPRVISIDVICFEDRFYVNKKGGIGRRGQAYSSDAMRTEL